MERLEKLFGIKSEEDPYLFIFLFGGISSMIIEWLKRGCSESTRERREALFRLKNALNRAT